jgi:hypothetical protein
MLTGNSMAHFHFVLSALLVGCVLGSIVAFWIFRPKEGGVKLTQVDTGEDAFAIATREDFVDGTPVDFQKFAAHVCDSEHE